MKRAAAVVAWLAAGHLVLGAFYWALLQVPESNVFMLTTSLLLVVTMALWTGLIEGTALLALSAKGAVTPSITTALRRSWLVVLPLALVALGVKLIEAGAGLALLETISAKMRIFRAPEFLGTAFLLAVLGMLIHFLLGA